MYKYKITVFTPTYNRGYIIGNLYKSLQNQSSKEFQWIVVDDGSTDNTNELFMSWIKESNDFDIMYIKVSNGGKHRAINKALELAKGELFFIVDSDDYLTENALERVIYWGLTIQDKEKFAGVAGNRGYTKEKIVGSNWDEEYIDATSLEREKYNLTGDKAEVFYTEILKKNLFPEFEGEKFLTERIIWDRIAYDGYKLRWFNEIIYICDYLEDGLTSSVKRLFVENPKGFALDIKTQIQVNELRGKKKWALWVIYYELVKDKITLKEVVKNLEANRYLMIVLINVWKIKERIKRIIR